MLNTVGSVAAVVVCLAAGSLTAQTNQAKCTWMGVNGKPVTDLCAYAPAGAKPLSPLPTTPAPTPPAQAFPFPGDTPATNSTQNSAVQPATTVPAATDATAPASKRFPFPGENPDTTPSAPAAPNPNPNGLKDAGSSGDSTQPSPDTSSSGSSSSSSSLPTAPADPNDPPDAAPIPHHSRRPLSTAKEKTPDEREDEDVSVAAFYLDTGNFQAAYMRAKEAVALVDNDPEAHLALAQASRKLGKLDEAQQHYKRCLELDPLPKDRKVADQALKEMSGKG